MFKVMARQVILAFAVGLAVACSPSPTATPTPLPPTNTPLPSTPTLAARPTATGIAQTPTALRSPSPAGSATPGPRENFLATYDAALAKIKTYRVKVVLDPSRQDDPERIMEVMLPDRFKQIQGSEIRQIGNTIYYFQPFPSVGHSTTLLPIFQRISLPWYRDQFAQAAQTTSLGRTVVDGVQLVGYQTSVKLVGLNASDPTTFMQIKEHPTKVWFSASNGFPVRIEVGQPLVFMDIFYDINAKIDEIGPP